MIAFFLGAHPEVSVAELRLLIGAKELMWNRSAAFFDIDAESALSIFKKLGGSPKVGEVISTFENTADFNQRFLPEMKSLMESVERKEYVLSLYGVRLGKRDFHRELKDLVTEGVVKYDGRFEEMIHPPAACEHVMKRGGMDLSLVPAGSKSYLVKTLLVQDAKEWSRLDTERPGRNMEIGMLPMKLARIMVNLSNIQPDGRLWDPFVGQGSIVIETAMRGIPALGTDKSRQSIEQAKATNAWAINNKKIKHGLVVLREQPIEKADLSEPASAIVTEPYLGKPHFKPFSGEFLAKREWTDISRLYELLLKLAARVLRRGQRIVFVKPIFAYIAGRERKWYNPKIELPRDSWKVPEIIRDLGPLVWVQKDTVVGREIVILERR